MFSAHRYRPPTMKSAPRPEPGHASADVPLDLRPVEGADADEDLAILAKALGHPTRVVIVRMLRQRSACTCMELVVELGLAQSTVSEHLRVLRDAGLVSTGSDAARGPYRIDVHRVRRLKALVGSV
jgi:ArsR family transcriptional regulator